MTPTTPARRRLTLAAAGCATAAAVAAGSMTTGAGQADAAAEHSLLGGTALAADWLGGSATSVAILPLSFAGTYASGSGSTATAVAVLGLAGASAPLLLGDGLAFCLGGFAFANSSSDGACVNVLGVFGAQYDKPGQNLQFALTNPLALLTGDISVGDVISGIASGNLNTALSADFVRLTFGGSDWQNLVRLTSSYGFQPISGAVPGAIEVQWLGTKVLLFPATQLNGDTSVNYLGMPRIEFGLPTGVGDIVPSLRTGAFKLPFDVTIPGIDTSDLLPLSDPTGTSARLAGVQDDLGGAFEDDSALQLANTETPVVESQRKEPTTDSAGTDSDTATSGDESAGTANTLSGTGTEIDAANDDDATPSATPATTPEITSGDSSTSDSDDEPAAAPTG